MKDKTLAQRFEFKYVLREPEAIPDIQAYLMSCLPLDEYSVAKPQFEYPVHSIYLDSDDFALANLNSNAKNRFKLRMRYYKEGKDQPIFFEIKRRLDNIIMKQRAAVKGPRAAVKILEGQMPQRSDYLIAGSKSEVAVQHFIELMQEANARPRVHVAYKRGAWVDDDHGVRATLDAKVSCEINEGPYFTTDTSDLIRVWKYTILELKFTNRFPDFFGDLVRRFGLVREAGPKYRDSVRVLTGNCGESDRIIPITDSALRMHIESREFLPRQLSEHPLLDAKPHGVRQTFY
jgi:hypothetical protein